MTKTFTIASFNVRFDGHSSEKYTTTGTGQTAIVEVAWCLISTHVTIHNQTDAKTSLLFTNVCIFRRSYLNSFYNLRDKISYLLLTNRSLYKTMKVPSESMNYSRRKGDYNHSKNTSLLARTRLKRWTDLRPRDQQKLSQKTFQKWVMAWLLHPYDKWASKKTDTTLPSSAFTSLTFTSKETGCITDAFSLDFSVFALEVSKLIPLHVQLVPFPLFRCFPLPWIWMLMWKQLHPSK